ncbi:MAG: GHKL domain-containing protein [Candidatus Omnitrophica bacterium]|nr:GHKL domain-containing protein [Candidatus Omnitrophota bacterium]
MDNITSNDFRSGRVKPDAGAASGGAAQRLKVEKQALEKANQDLRQMQNQLIQTEKMASLGRLAGGIAHEINNPITYINTNLGVLGQYLDTLEDMLKFYAQLEAAARASSADDLAVALGQAEDFRLEADLPGLLADSRKLIQESSWGAEQVSKIVSDLKTFAREEKAEQEHSDLHAILNSTLNITWSNLKYSVEVVKSYGELPRVLCYPWQLEQVFVNLLLNAAQAVGKKGRISLRTFREHDEALIEIEDNGCGIRERDLPRIFEPFFTTREVGQGTGLGLSIVYNIIEKHEGQIMVRSAPGKGTAVIIRLPIGGKSK